MQTLRLPRWEESLISSPLSAFVVDVTNELDTVQAVCAGSEQSGIFRVSLI